MNMEITNISCANKELIVTNARGYEYYYSLTDNIVRSKRGRLKNPPFSRGDYFNLTGVYYEIGREICNRGMNYNYNYIIALLENIIVQYYKEKNYCYFLTMIGSIVRYDFVKRDWTYVEKYEEKENKWSNVPKWLKNQLSVSFVKTCMLRECIITFADKIEEIGISRNISLSNIIFSDTKFIEYCVNNNVTISEVSREEYATSNKKKYLTQKYGSNKAELIFNYITHIYEQNIMSYSDEDLDDIAQVLPFLTNAAKKFHHCYLSKEYMHMFRYYKDKLDVNKTLAENIEIVNAYRMQFIDLRFKQIHDKFQEIESIEKDGLTILIPQKMEDVVAEGKAMHNCVGTHCLYQDTVKENRGIIFFIRKVNNKESSFVTCFHKFGTQSYDECRGFSNGTASAESKKLFDIACGKIEDIYNGGI